MNMIQIKFSSNSIKRRLPFSSSFKTGAKVSSFAYVFLLNWCKSETVLKYTKEPL